MTMNENELFEARKNEVLAEMAQMRPKALARIKRGIPAVSVEYDPKRLAKTMVDKIVSINQSENAANRMMLQAREKGFVVSALILEKGKRGNVQVSRTIAQCAGNEYSWHLPKSNDPVMVTNQGLPSIVENYTDFYLFVYFPENDEHNDWRYLVDAVIIKDSNCNFWWNLGEEGAFVNMLNGLEHANPEKLKAEGMIYGADPECMENLETMTAGQSKRLLMPYVARKYSEEYKILKYLMTSGGSVAMFLSEEATAKDIAQTNNRLSNPEAAATPMAEVECAAFYFGKVISARGKEYRDGFGFTNCEWWSKVLTMRSGYRKYFTTDSVVGQLLQARPGQWKAMGECVTPDYLEAFVKRKGWEVIPILKPEMTDDEIWYFICAAAKKTSPYKEKLVVLCNTQELKQEIEKGNFKAIQILTDMNGNKAAFDPVMPILFNLLSVSHPCKDIKHGANLSTQLLQTLLIADSFKAWKFVMNEYKKQVKGKMEQLDEENVQEPSIQDLVNEKTNMAQLLVQMCPAVVTRWYFPLLKSVADNTLQGLSRDAQNLSITTEGIYCKIITDPAMDFDINLLGIKDGEMEVLCPGAEREGYTRGVAIKYPKCHFREWGKCRIVPIEEYIQRVRDSELEQEDKDRLIFKVRHLSNGCIVLPAIELVKNMLAGLDFDGDALILYLNEELCELVWKNEKVSPLAVCIQPKGSMTDTDEENVYGKIMTQKLSAS